MSPTAATLAFLLVTVIYMVPSSETKTVVSIPFPFTSHAKYHVSVAKVLARRGHQMWVALPSYVLDKGYLDTSGVNAISYDTIPGLEPKLQAILSDSYFESNKDKLFEFLRECRNIFDHLLRNDSFIRDVGEKQSDLIVIDNIPIYYAMSIIPYRLGIPFAFLGSSYYPPTMRIPFSPADVPLTILPYSNKMSFLQRLHNTLFFALFSVYNPSIPDDAVTTYAPEMKYLSLTALANKAEVFLVEVDHVLDYPRPTLPNVKLIGGTATGPSKALPPEFQSFMDSAKEGVVIVSFGSYVLHLPNHISDKILKVLLQLPMKSVFRSDLTSPDPKKILTAPWIPQNDLLGHPHTKVFVSHCGKNGQYEALYHTVPVVATPLFLDQVYNAERGRVKGFAEVLDLNTCTAEQMTSAILTVAKEARYKEAAVNISRLFKELYGDPKETAAYWLEHVMEYGGGYMRSAGQEMPLYQYVLLDVFLFIVCVLVLAIGVLCLIIKAMCKCLRKRKAKAE